MSFSNLKLSTSLLLTLEDIGYKNPTAVQAKVIPEVLARHDVLVKAKTGSGKTAAYSLPIIQLLNQYSNKSASPANHPIQAIILAPTRELAQQIGNNLTYFLQLSDLRSTTIYGGNDYNAQLSELKKGVEIVVATVGRLLDHIRNKTINLDNIRFLVLDEADRMLDMGFLPQINEIIEVLPGCRQNLLFSATYSSDIRMLAQKYMRDPVSINIHHNIEVSDEINHGYYLCASVNKLSIIESIINQRPGQQALIFANTKLTVKKIATNLKTDNYSVNDLHGDMSQIERDQVMQRFRDQDLQLLVATDVAARGLDIPSLPMVINYSPPNTANEYIHRVGRTGRAGTSGEAITLCANNEQEYLKEIERLIGKKIPKSNLPSKTFSNTIQDQQEVLKPKISKNIKPRTCIPALLRNPDI